MGDWWSCARVMLEKLNCEYLNSAGRNHGTPDMMSPLTTVTSSPSNHVTSPNSHMTSQHQYQMTSSQHVAASPHSAEYESPLQNRSSTLGRMHHPSVLPHKSYQVWMLLNINRFSLYISYILCCLSACSSRFSTSRHCELAIQNFKRHKPDLKALIIEIYPVIVQLIQLLLPVL